jgi:hypothetical protein
VTEPEQAGVDAGAHQVEHVLHAGSSFLMTFAGVPAAKTFGGMSLFTTEFGPITGPSLMVTPWHDADVPAEPA